PSSHPRGAIPRRIDTTTCCANISAMTKTIKKRAPGRRPSSTRMREAKFRVGDVVRHRYHPFRGVIFDVDPVFNSTEEWWRSIPEKMRPRKDQPFYHLLAENDETE